MKIKVFISLLILSNTVFAQDKLITKNGTISFEASVPSFEEIKAKNTTSSCILNTKTGEIAALALMKGFDFKIALMEEHFNENYVESDKFPKATFKGKIENFDYLKITPSYQNFNLIGKLELHGRAKDIAVIAKIRKTSAGLEIISNFPINTEEFAIEIPNIVSKKVSKKVNITLDFILK